MQILKRIFANKTEKELIEIRILSPDTKNVITRKWFDDPEDATKIVHDHKEKNNVYFGVTAKNQQKSSSEAFSNAYCLWADIDDTEPNDMPPFVLPPSLVVVSGKGLHAYWMLDEPCGDAETVQAVNKLIQHCLESDSVSDVARLLRVDNTFNHKRNNAEPVQIIYDKPAITYPIKDITRAVGMADFYHKLADSEVLMPPPDKSVEDGSWSWSEQGWALVLACVEAGLTDQTIKHIFFYNHIGKKARKEKGYLEGEIKRAKNKITKKSEVKIKSKRKKVKGKQRIVDTDDDDDDTVGSGEIYAADCQYFKAGSGRKTKDKRLSNFEIVIDHIIQGDQDTEDVMVGNICTPNGQMETFRVLKSTFNSRNYLVKFLKRFDYSWYGTDTDLQYVQNYISKNSDRGQYRTGVNKVGYHGGYWVGTDQVMAGGLDAPMIESPIVFVKEKSNTLILEYADRRATTKELEQFFAHIFHINKERVVYPILGWWCASLFKSRLPREVKLPFLNVYGTKGSGKTATLEMLQYLSGYRNRRFQVCNTTKFVIMSLLAESNDVLVSLTEYRKSFIQRSHGNNLHQYLLTLYDGGSDARGSKDQKVHTRQLTSPVTIDGEDAVDDPALLERCIQVNFSKTTITDVNYQENFAAIKDHNFLRLIGTEIIKFSLDKDFTTYLQQAKEMCEVNDETMHFRVRENVEVSLAGLLFLKEFMEQKIDASLNVSCEWFDLVVKEADTDRLVVDDFIEDVINYCARTTGHSQFSFKTERDMVWFHLADAVSWWRQKRVKEQRESMELKAIRTQLKERQDNYFQGFKTVRIDTNSVWCCGINITEANKIGLNFPVIRKYTIATKNGRFKEA